MPLTPQETQQLEDFLALIAMPFVGTYVPDDLSAIVERHEAREARRHGS